MDIQNYWKYCLEQDADHMRLFFAANAYIIGTSIH